MTNAIISAVIAPGPALPGGPSAPRAPAPAPKSLGRQNIEARFSFDKELAQVIITLRDTETGEIVRQIPPEKVLHFAQFLLEQLTGRVLNARA